MKFFNNPAIKGKHAFTLTELMLTIAISFLIFLAAGILLADGSQWFSGNYSKINSQPAIDCIIARKTFERVMRQATGKGYIVSADGSYVEANYYSDSSLIADRYAKFYTLGNDLIFETGTLDPHTTLTTDTICQNVSDCTFKGTGTAVQMILELDDGTNKQSSVVSAVMNN